jgi:hypothetical protein
MPEPSVPRPQGIPERGDHVIPGEVPEGVVPPSTSMTTPPDQPLADGERELLERKVREDELRDRARVLRAALDADQPKETT